MNLLINIDSCKHIRAGYCFLIDSWSFFLGIATQTDKKNANAWCHVGPQLVHNLQVLVSLCIPAHMWWMGFWEKTTLSCERKAGGHSWGDVRCWRRKCTAPMWPQPLSQGRVSQWAAISSKDKLGRYDRIHVKHGLQRFNFHQSFLHMVHAWRDC